MKVDNKQIMEVVDKVTLSKHIAHRIGLTITDVMKIIDVFEEEIINAIKENKKVQLNGFLVFIPKNVEAMTMVSPLDKKEYNIPAKRTVEVRVGKFFKDDIKGSYQPEVKEDDSSKKSTRTKREKKSNT